MGGVRRVMKWGGWVGGEGESCVINKNNFKKLTANKNRHFMSQAHICVRQRRTAKLGLYYDGIRTAQPIKFYILRGA